MDLDKLEARLHISCLRCYNPVSDDHYEAERELLTLARKAQRYEKALGGLIEAANGLRNNSSGYRAFEPEIREVIGHTNWAVTQHWIEQADAALLKARQALESSGDE